MFTYRCFECGMDFFGEEPTEALVQEADDRIIDDDQALREAEEEIKNQTDEDGDRRFK